MIGRHKFKNDQHRCFQGHPLFKLGLIAAFTLIFGFCYGQDEMIVKANEAVDGHQNRIDLMDGTNDGIVSLISETQTKIATDLYIFKVNRVQKNINNDNNLKPSDKKRLLQQLSKVLESVNRGNFFMYNSNDMYFDMIIKVQEVVDQQRIVTLLKSDLLTSLHIIPFFDYKPYASEILKLAAKVQPSELLTFFKDFSDQKYAADVLDEICKQAPMHVSFYMGTSNPVFLLMRNRRDLYHINLMIELYQKVGSNSRAYMLIDPISKFKLTYEEAHELAMDRDSLYRTLMQIRMAKDILGAYSVDDELTYLSLLRVREVNELHEETDLIRFGICDSLNMSASELYTMMVYGEDEIYTSTFLGLFSRFMERMNAKSSFEFLHSVGMNEYRTFIKMCAGYNTLSIFLSKMSEWEKRSLFNKLTNGLQNETNPLEQAVAVADTYASLNSKQDKEILATALMKEYEAIRWNNREAEKLYTILISVLGLDLTNSDVRADVMAASTISKEQLFKNNEHIQQHFFFDDEDGWASYNSFLARFSRSGWTLIDKGLYVIIQSTSGKSVKIYANKASEEYEGQEALKNLFKKSGRYPDAVIHRGHSYYAGATIKTLTPNAELVILGSCGGYNNINTVLNYAPDAQIIASKQVGTMTVNNELIFTICENIRLGKNLEWEPLWNQVGMVLKRDALATDRFDDYLPPHKNLGAILIRSYRKSL